MAALFSSRPLSRLPLSAVALISAVSFAVASAACSGGSGGPTSAEPPDARAGETPRDGTDASGVARVDASSEDATTSDGGVDATSEPDAATVDAGQATDASDATDTTPPPPSLGFDCAAEWGDGGAHEAGAPDHPTSLACTGLYEVWPTRTIAKSVQAFDPGIHLFSDGADKSRFIHLPPGTRIDTTDMDEWTFPVGTKVWKEFRLGGKPVETRYLWKRGDGDWVRTTYAWSDDGASATELTTGATNVFGTAYEIPPQSACTACHAGRKDFVLGFEVVGLGSPAATGLNLSALAAKGLLTSPPPRPPVIPGNATEQAALGWLHANCGTACHNPSPGSLAGRTGLFMRLAYDKLASVTGTDTWQTAVNVPSNFQPYPDANFLRISPGDVSKSAIPFRAGTRDDQGQQFQMPPIDTHVVDTADVAVLKSWIGAMPKSP